MGNAVERVISMDGTPIAVEVQGTGPALVLLDGAMCSRGFGPMPALAKALAPHFTVYHYDRRGRGESGNGFAYDVQREIEDLDAVIQKAGGEAMVFGMSSGAALAGEAARQLRGIRRLALYEAPYVVDDTHEPLPATFIADTKTLVTAGRRGEAVKKFMRYVGTPSFAVAIMSWLPMWRKLLSHAGSALVAVSVTWIGLSTLLADWSSQYPGFNWDVAVTIGVPLIWAGLFIRQRSRKERWDDL